MKRQPNRKHSKIDALPPELKTTVQQMLLTGYKYWQIQDYLAENGVSISLAAICNHARRFRADVETLTIANENFKAMLEELERCPDLDTTEAIVRLTSQNLYKALSNTSEEDWQDIKPQELMKQATGLVRAAAYKKRIEVQNQTDTEAGLEAVRQLVFEAMAKKRPDLYEEVNKFLKAERLEQEGT